MKARMKDNRTRRQRLFGEKDGGFQFKWLDSLNLYTRLLSEKTTGGLTDTPQVPLGEAEFYYTSDRIYTRKGVKKIYFVMDFPEELRRGFVTDIRYVINKDIISYNQSNATNERVDVSLILDSKHFSLDLSDRRIRGRWEYFTRQYETVQKKAGQKKLQDELKSDKYSEAIKRKVNSFLYIKEAKDVYDSSFYKTTVILEFVASNNDVLMVAERAFQNYIINSKLKVKPIFIQTNEYQKTYMPMAHSKPTLLSKMHKGDVFTDDIISSFSMTTHGSVGDPLGIYHGIDIESKLPVTFDFSKGSDARNILLTAQSGEGKSNMAKMIYTFTIPLDDVYRTIVLDYEGEQFDAIGKLANASIVSVGSGEGRYVNTMVIGDFTGIESIDSNLKIEAMTSTERIFNVLVDENEGMERYELAIFSDAINDVYLDFGVTDEPDTWHLSKDITFFHIYAKINSYINSEKKIMEYDGREKIQSLAIALKPYFERGGTRNHWFKEPISVQEIIDKKHLIFSFGMKGQDESKVDTKHLAIRQMFVSYLVNLIASQNRAKNLRTVIFVEEMQRYMKQKFSGEILSAMSSGGRKLGMIVYYITNSPSELIHMSGKGFDRNLSTNASTLMTNMNIQIIGALYKNDMDNLIDEFGLENARGILYSLSDIIESGGTSNYKYCFYTRYKNQSTVIRTLSHPVLEGLPLYDTVHDADSSEDYEVDGKLKLNVGEDAIRTQIEIAYEDEQLRDINDTWSDIMSDYSNSNNPNIWSNNE